MIYLITNRHLVSEKRYIEVLKQASDSGVKRIILREKDLSTCNLEKLYYKIKHTISEETKIIINSNIECAKKVGAFGIHLTFNDFLNYKLTNNFIVGVSVHTLEEAIIANKKGASYILASNVYATKCKKGVEGKGVEFIREIAHRVDTKVIALGGITRYNFREVYDAGANGIGIMSEIMQSNNVKDLIDKLLDNNQKELP
ncbi:thiamine phosphate synthase [Clostridium cylindrosporum]|uniref:Thiamine-phosphate synthase ThiE n=1 Tax=Clostridium cylindrosporum DSM 605 TaxID=1121307 RepID=A0A0J8G6I1_CLOCY|nr:thiamine phosphate synthase [Clostridium cylindrosporum]KMT23216.1 thiamine-phosphate synthase ThiE [Clostridium cylindrosporum DSM 605]